MSRPLLLGCTDVYPGPWVPTSGLKGKLRAEGLEPGDEIAIRIRDVTEHEDDTVIYVTEDLEMKVDLSHAFIRADRIKSTGSEIYVWLE